MAKLDELVVKIDIESAQVKDIKAGRRHNAVDQGAIQTAHDALVNAGAECNMGDMPAKADMSGETKSLSLDTLMNWGEAVKATVLDNGDVKLAGYLVRYGDAAKTDLTGDYFTPATDFGSVETSAGWFNHRLPVRFGNKTVTYDQQLPDVKLRKDDVGIFAEIILGASDEYQKMIGELGIKGALGWSSGTAPHLVDRKQVGNATEIIRWPLGLDASLTPTPAEPRNTVMQIKSLLPSEAHGGTDDTKTINREKTIMENKEELKALFEENNKTIVESLKVEAEAAAKKAVDDVLEKLPEVKAKMGPTVQVTTDEADREFTSIAEHARAVKAWAISKKYDPRFKRLAALEAKAIQGASEAIPGDGGILLEPTLSQQFIAPLHETGAFSADISMLPVGTNSNYGYINGVDETSRVAGSRWGGVRGYRLSEGDTVTKSKPTFRRIQWELKKYGVLVYGTDELLADVNQYAAIVNQAATEELAFMVNDDIMNGLGVSGAQGFMNSGALITVTRDSGSKVLGTDISAMWQRLSPGSQGKAKWYIHTSVTPQLDGLFAVGSTAVLFPYAGYRPDGVRTLYGRPVVVTEYNQALNTTGDIVLADMSQYLGWEKGGVNYATSIHVEFLTDQEVMRYIYRFDGKSAFSSALTDYHGSGTTSPFVVLGSAT